MCQQVRHQVKRRLYEVLKSQVLQMNQQVVFLSDGGDTMRDLRHYLSPEAASEAAAYGATQRPADVGV